MTDPAVYRARREEVLRRLGKGAAVFFSAPHFIRNNDVEHEYRQDSDFYYLSGFAEPESVLVFSNTHAEHKSVLFVRPRDPSREIWDGPRAGVDGAVKDFGVDAAFPISELAARLPEYLNNAPRVLFTAGHISKYDEQFFEALRVVRTKQRLGWTAPTELVFATSIVHDMRLRKSPEEIALMQRACDITREAHLRAMQVARPGAYEYQVEAEILATYRAHGAERAAYGSIVGAGNAATILHYRTNDRRMNDDDLLLIDAGVEYGYYASDVTRTFPVSGKFTEPQRQLYALVLRSQEQAIAATRPGTTLEAIHEGVVQTLTQGLIDLGLLGGTLESNLQSGAYKKYYMHRTSHWLGMDVHDVGTYLVDQKPRALEPGFVLTIEPGLYVPSDADCDAQWRGIGIRIEDDILVTVDGCTNLTASIPKQIAEIEAILAAR